MTESWDELSITMDVPLSASALERDGMLKRMEDAVGQAISGIPNGYIMSSDVDPEKLRVDLEAAGVARPDMLGAVADSLSALLEAPDATAWGPYAIEARDAEPDDADVSEFRDRLIREADFVRPHLDATSLTALDADADDDEERDAAASESELVAGALFQACVLVVDHLFDDLENLLTSGEDASVATADADFLVLANLPPRYRHRYSALFAKEFIVATVCVTQRFTNGWVPLSCVAEELALRMILEQAEVQLELADAGVSPGWRAVLEDTLFEDVDHEMLYQADLDGAENDSEFLESISAAPMGFADWFTPFKSGADAEQNLPPYLLDGTEPTIDDV